MNTSRTSHFKKGFTLMELMVAMAVTSIIVTVLVSITSIALDTWNRSRSELRASRQAKSMLDVMARDFEALVTRRGNTNEWLSAVVPTVLPGTSGSLNSTNACNLIFFTAATDRYNGDLGTATDLGDVCCVGYKLDYRDPMAQTGSSTGNEFETFILSRKLVDPDLTFQNLLGQADLEGAFSQSYSAQLTDPNNFVCENIYQFTVTFHVQITDSTQTPPVSTKQIILGRDTTGFKITGNGIKTEPASSDPYLASGRVTAVEISTTVISDFGIDQIKRRNFSTEDAKDEFLLKNSYQYTKLVQLNSM